MYNFKYSFSINDMWGIGLLGPPDVLRLAGIVWVELLGHQGVDSGVPAVPHHLQRGGGCGSEELVLGDGRGIRRVGRDRKGGQIPNYFLLRG